MFEISVFDLGEIERGTKFNQFFKWVEDKVLKDNELSWDRKGHVKVTKWSDCIGSELWLIWSFGLDLVVNW